MRFEKTVAVALLAVLTPVAALAQYRVNRANFTIPGFTLGAADFGVISSARAPRTLQP
jgi:hypothetical protein